MNSQNLDKYHIILASQSPRRREILSRMGLPFTVLPASDREITEETEPARIVEALSSHKAAEVYEKLRQAERGGSATASMPSPEGSSADHFRSGETAPLFVIGADTVVVIDGQILGKPEDPEDAARMLGLLSGRSHSVLTGVTLIREESDGSRMHIFHEETQVFFRELREEEIAAYIASGEPMDKAGSYGIQGFGGAFVEHIAGDYDNVVGFPYARFLRESEAFLNPGGRKTNSQDQMDDLSEGDSHASDL